MADSNFNGRQFPNVYESRYHQNSQFQPKFYVEEASFSSPTLAKTRSPYSFLPRVNNTGMPLENSPPLIDRFSTASRELTTNRRAQSAMGSFCGGGSYPVKDTYMIEKTAIVSGGDNDDSSLLDIYVDNEPAEDYYDSENDDNEDYEMFVWSNNKRQPVLPMKSQNSGYRYVTVDDENNEPQRYWDKGAAAAIEAIYFEPSEQERATTATEGIYFFKKGPDEDDVIDLSSFPSSTLPLLEQNKDDVNEDNNLVYFNIPDDYPDNMLFYDYFGESMSKGGQQPIEDKMISIKWIPTSESYPIPNYPFRVIYDNELGRPKKKKVFIPEEKSRSPFIKNPIKVIPSLVPISTYQLLQSNINSSLINNSNNNTKGFPLYKRIGKTASRPFIDKYRPLYMSQTQFSAPCLNAETSDNRKVDQENILYTENYRLEPPKADMAMEMVPTESDDQKKLNGHQVEQSQSNKVQDRIKMYEEGAAVKTQQCQSNPFLIDNTTTVSSSQNSTTKVTTTTSVAKENLTTAKNLERKLDYVQKENVALRMGLSEIETKLGASVEGIKRFWAPELARTRKVLKDDQYKLKSMTERYKVLCNENQKLMKTLESLIVQPANVTTMKGAILLNTKSSTTESLNPPTSSLSKKNNDIHQQSVTNDISKCASTTNFQNKTGVVSIEIEKLGKLLKTKEELEARNEHLQERQEEIEGQIKLQHVTLKSRDETVKHLLELLSQYARPPFDDEGGPETDDDNSGGVFDRHGRQFFNYPSQTQRSSATPDFYDDHNHNIYHPHYNVIRYEESDYFKDDPRIDRPNTTPSTEKYSKRRRDLSRHNRHPTPEDLIREYFLKEGMSWQLLKSKLLAAESRIELLEKQLARRNVELQKSKNQTESRDTLMENLSKISILRSVIEAKDVRITSLEAEKLILEKEQFQMVAAPNNVLVGVRPPPQLPPSLLAKQDLAFKHPHPVTCIITGSHKKGDAQTIAAGTHLYDKSIKISATKESATDAANQMFNMATDNHDGHVIKTNTNNHHHPSNNQMDLESLKRELDKSTIELTGYKTRYETLVKQLEDYTRHIAFLKENAGAKDAHATVLQADIDSLRRRLDEVIGAYEKSKEGVKDGLRAKNSSANRMAELVQHLDIKEQTIQIYQRKVNSLEDLLREKDSQLKAMIRKFQEKLTGTTKVAAVGTSLTGTPSKISRDDSGFVTEISCDNLRTVPVTNSTAHYGEFDGTSKSCLRSNSESQSHLSSFQTSSLSSLSSWTDIITTGAPITEDIATVDFVRTTKNDDKHIHAGLLTPHKLNILPTGLEKEKVLVGSSEISEGKPPPLLFTGEEYSPTTAALLTNQRLTKKSPSMKQIAQFAQDLEEKEKGEVFDDIAHGFIKVIPSQVKTNEEHNHQKAELVKKEHDSQFELQEQLSKLKEALNCAENEIETLKRDKIPSLLVTVDEKDNQIRQLTAQLSSMDEKRLSHEREVEAYERLKALNAELETKLQSANKVLGDTCDKLKWNETETDKVRSAFNDVSREIVNLKGQIRTLKDKLRNQETLIDKYVDEGAQMRRELQKINQQSTTLETDYRKRVTTLETEIKSKNQDLAQKEREIDRLTKVLKLLEQDKLAVESEMIELRREMSQLNQREPDHPNRASSGNANDDKEAEEERLEKMAEFEERVEDLETELEEKEKVLEELKTKFEETLKEVVAQKLITDTVKREYQVSLDKIEIENKRLKDSVENLQIHIQKNVDRIEELEEELSRALHITAETRVQMESRSSKDTEKTNEMSLLSEKNVELGKLVDQQTVKINEIFLKYKEKDVTLKSLIAERNNIMQELVECRKEMCKCGISEKDAMMALLGTTMGPRTEEQVNALRKEKEVLVQKLKMAELN